MRILSRELRNALSTVAHAEREPSVRDQRYPVAELFETLDGLPEYLLADEVVYCSVHDERVADDLTDRRVPVPQHGRQYKRPESLFAAPTTHLKPLIRASRLQTRPRSSFV